MNEHFAVRRALEQRALGHQVGAQLDGIGEVAVVRERQRTFAVPGEHGLRVREHRRSSGGVAGVTDGDVPRQVGHDALAENVGDEPHTAMGSGHPFRVHRYDPGGLLPSMLQAVEAEVGDSRRVGDAGDTDDAAHRAGQSPMRRGSAVKYTSRSRSTECSMLVSRRRTRTAAPWSPTLPTRHAGTPSSCASAATATARTGEHVTTARPCDSLNSIS